MGRVSVIRNDRVVPLLPGNPEKSSIVSPRNGLIAEKHSIGAIEIPEHEHHAFCLHMQLSGPVGMEWWSEGRNGKETPGAGSLILLGPGTRDRLRWSGPSQRLVISIEEAYLQRAAKELGRKGSLDFVNHWRLEDKQLALLLSEIRREMESGWATGPLYGDLIGMSLSVALIQKYASGSSGTVRAAGGISKARLKRVLDYIHENSHADLRLDAMAQVADMSVFHFARLFRDAMGVSPHRYLLEQRLQRAMSLLRLGSRSVAEVAAETGFSDAGHFARAFRKHAGMSPTEWARER